MNHQAVKSTSGFQFNWGTGIVISFILFCSFIIYIVVRAFQLDMDLVSETYYSDELAYQERITERTNLAYSGNRITVSQTNEEVVIGFPQDFSSATGDLYFYHPSKAIFDKHFQISLTEDNQQRIPKGELVKGNYRVKAQWKVGDVPYFQEIEIYLK